MRKLSSFASTFSDTVINAMLQIPKHLFVDMTVYKNNTKITDDDECVKSIYDYSKALCASQAQNMSSAEITAAQLSLIPLNSGDRVLFLGAKGGYIQAIAAQIVGFQGQVWICSQDNQGLQHVKNVLRNHAPSMVKQIIKCVLVNNMHNVNELKKGLEEYFTSTKEYFNTIYACGAISQDSVEHFQEFLTVQGQFLAPINIDQNNQKFTILSKTRDSNSGQVIINKRVLTDWGIIFAPVL
jgi:protein-L-isoaspartate O-methyltransferase